MKQEMLMTLSLFQTALFIIQKTVDKTLNLQNFPIGIVVNIFKINLHNFHTDLYQTKLTSWQLFKARKHTKHLDTSTYIHLYITI